MAGQKPKSAEPYIAQLGNGWLRAYGLDYKLEQEPLNREIDNALSEYFTKNGGAGRNRPDAKLLLRDGGQGQWPVLIEYKGYEDRLARLDADGHVENRRKDDTPNFTNINSYAVNGAVHYANAILHYTSYTDIISIGMTGWRDTSGTLRHRIGVYYVAKSNFGAGQEVGEYTDFSFLAPENFGAFIERVRALSLTQEEIDKIRGQREREITASLTRLNNDIYQNEKLGESERVYLVAASIIATLGIPGSVASLEKKDLGSSMEKGNTDGDIIMRKVIAFLDERRLPKEKEDSIVRTLATTLLNDNINRPVNGESQLKRVFSKIVDDLGIYYKIGLTTDFTGKLFNEMYGWFGYAQDRRNDIVLTPPYIGTLLARLARVSRDSYVWDFATGSAGLLVAAMNEMLADAHKHMASPEELRRKQAHIKQRQLLGVELDQNVYMLAVLNMILMGDGSSNLINEDSLRQYDGSYADGDEKFPADAFVLNPPYSAPGRGMVFVEKALGMMRKGYAAIIIQNSAGAGKAIEYNRRILKHSTLLASIKMPVDLFAGKSSVQTYIYVFRVGEAHQRDDTVRFIDFSNDGYMRTDRHKARRNLYDVGHAAERYQEVADLVRYGRRKLRFLSEAEYHEGTIDPCNGADWNQVTRAGASALTLQDIKRMVDTHFAWEVTSLLLKRQPRQTEKNEREDTAAIGCTLTDEEKNSLERFGNLHWESFRICDLFGKIKTRKLPYKVKELPEEPVGDFVLPALTAGIQNQGLNCYVPRAGATVLKDVISISANGANTGATFFQSGEFTVLQDAYAIEWKGVKKPTAGQYLFMAAAIAKSVYGNYEWTNKAGWERIKDDRILLPSFEGMPDFHYMSLLVSALRKQAVREIEWFAGKGTAATTNE